MTTAKWYARRGDAGRTMTVRLKDDIDYVDLSGALVEFQAKMGTNVIQGAAVVHSNQVTHKGEVTYTLTADDLVAAAIGIYDVAWVATWSVDEILTFPSPSTDELEIEGPLV